MQSFGYFLGGVDAGAVCKWHYLKKIVHTLSNARNTTPKLTKNSFLTLSTPFSRIRPSSPRSLPLETFCRRDEVPSGKRRGETAVFAGLVFALA